MQTREHQTKTVAQPELQFYRVPDAAALLGINRITLYAKVKKGELPPLQSVGGIKGYTGARILSIYDASA